MYYNKVNYKKNKKILTNQGILATLYIDVYTNNDLQKCLPSNSFAAEAIKGTTEMANNFNELISAAITAKANHAAIVEVEKIKFVEDFRKACEQNVCRKYATNWMCPPGVGSFEEVKAKACRYQYGLLFQTVHQIASSFDWKGMMAAKQVHDKVFREVLSNVKNKHSLQDILPLNAGACEFCNRCTFLDQEPCRFSEEAFPSVEAFGIDVISLEKTCGIPYYNGKNTVSYVGLILFN